MKSRMFTMLTMMATGLMAFAFAPQSSMAKKAAPTCTKICKGQAVTMGVTCNMHKKKGLERCKMWSKRLKEACLFKKVADRNKVCTKKRSDIGKVCNEHHKQGQQSCDYNHKRCQGQVEHYCQRRCMLAWKGKRKECMKTCSEYRKAKCNRGHMGCKALVTAAKSTCLFEADHRRDACLRNMSDVDRCKDAQKNVAKRCTIKTKLAYNACRAMSIAAEKSCPAACFYSYR